MEKFHKIKKRDLKDLKNQLESTLKEAARSLEIASQTASCCEVSIECLISEIKSCIFNTKQHLKHGILTEDLIK